MELKTARLTLLIDPNKKVAFERLCAAQDRTASQVVRQLIRDYLAYHGVAHQISGEKHITAKPAADATAPPTTAQARGSRRSGPRTRARRRGG